MRTRKVTLHFRRDEYVIIPPTTLISAILQTGLAVIYAAIGVIVMLFAVYYGGRCVVGITSAAADFVLPERQKDEP